MRKFLFVIPVILLLFSATTTYAAKPRVRKATTTTRTASGGVAYSSAKLSRGTNSVILTLLNLDKVSSVQYVLSYTSNGIPQGAIGTITPSGTTETRDLYFGTCSKNVCTPHPKITNATLTATSYLKSGGTYVKRYRIKI